MAPLLDGREPPHFSYSIPNANLKGFTLLRNPKKNNCGINGENLPSELFTQISFYNRGGNGPSYSGSHLCFGNCQSGQKFATTHQQLAGKFAALSQNPAKNRHNAKILTRIRKSKQMNVGVCRVRRDNSPSKGNLFQFLDILHGGGPLAEVGVWGWIIPVKLECAELVKIQLQACSNWSH
jgi:hypothetical protein